MASFTSLVMLLCVMIMSVIYVDATVRMLNDKTCAVREDPITYIPTEYECKFQGAGLYIFEERSPSTVKKLSVDLLTDLSFFEIPQGTGLEKIYLVEGSCEQIKGSNECGDMGSRETLLVEITTDDHEEITKPVHEDQTTVDEMSKPSSEKTTMKTFISSQQYGSN
ncbi:Hypothetical predicted protein [Mytilus galloprovincialis]|uniref:Uncharacterized protein n=1 Tax=Mytilus galloprovincialis TaxID=29158 RepID=A0A8B6BQP7_MYTGA|nr:Hypothetical predicted protein [Mytilus galloprovincialis]